MLKITCHFVPGKVPVQFPKMYTCERDAHNVHCDPEYVEHIVPNGAVDHGTGVHMSRCVSWTRQGPAEQGGSQVNSEACEPNYK